MNPFALSGLSVGISCLLLSAIAFLFGRTKLHRLLLFFNIACALWGFGIFLVGTANTEAQAILGWQIAHLGGFFIGPVFYHMVTIFCETKNKKLLFLGYFQASFFNLFSFGTNYVFNKLRSSYDLYFNEVSGLYLIAVLSYLFFVSLAYYDLIRFYKTAKGYRRTQASYIIYGFLFGFAGGTATFLPMFHIDLLYPIGNFSIVLYSLILSYAILRHRVMDFSLAIKKSLVYSLSISILTALYVVLVLITTKYLSEFLGITSFTITVASALIIAVLFAPLKNRVQVFVDKVFYKTTYDYYATVQKISHEFASTIELKRTYRLIVDTMFETLKPRGAYLISLRDETSEVVCERSSQEMTSSGNGENKIDQIVRRPVLRETSELVRQLKGNNIISREEISLVLDEEKSRSVADELALFEGEVAAPLFIENELAYILVLGEKRSGDGYSDADIKLLTTVANQSAIALKNARLYNELEQRVEEMMNKLMVAKKLESIGILAGGIAHDFNNILTIILMNTSLIKSGFAPEDEAYRLLTKTEKVCRTAKKLTAKLVTFSEGGMPIKQPASVKETIQETVDSSLYAPAIRNEYIIPDDLWDVEFDKDQITQVVRNLALNAQEAMPQGGVITFSAENVLLDGDVRNTTPLPEGRYIRISIRDRGVGIPQKSLEKIFDPYFTTKPMGAEKGLGLGLAICHSIIRQHNGHISVESEVGSGATFHIYLPAGVKG